MTRCETQCVVTEWLAEHCWPCLLVLNCNIVCVCRYLIEKGANLEAVNNDGELAIDLAEGKDMETLISEAMEKQGMYAAGLHNIK